MEERERCEKTLHGERMKSGARAERERRGRREAKKEPHAVCRVRLFLTFRIHQSVEREGGGPNVIDSLAFGKFFDVGRYYPFVYFA